MYVNNELRFICSDKGTRGSQIIELNTLTANIISGDVNNIIHGIYDLKNLYQFTRFSNLSQYLELRLVNNHALKITYPCSDLGSISLFSMPYYFSE